MTLPCGSRRLALAASVAALSGGLLFAVLLAAAWVWSLRQDGQREATLAADGCPAHSEPTAPVIGVEFLGFHRWLVTKNIASVSTPETLPLLIDSPDFGLADRERRRILLSVFAYWFATATRVQQDLLLREIAERIPEPPASPGALTARLEAATGTLTISDYVVSADRGLSLIEVAQVTHEATGARGHSRPGIEVIDCLEERRDISRAQEKALNHRLIKWWIGQPLFVSWIAVAALGSRRTLVLATILLALLLTGTAATLPWGLLYLVRWIERRFGATK